MSNREKFRHKVYCRSCTNETNHTILSKHSIGSNEGLEWAYWREDYMIAECMGCNTVTFIKEFDAAYMQEFENDDGSLGAEDIQVFPPKPKETRVIGHPPIYFTSLPEGLNVLYRQVVESYELGYFALAVAGLRMIVEGICNELSIESGYVIDKKTNEIKLNKQDKPIRENNLRGRINGLAEKGILTRNQVETLQFVRLVGNQTVHELQVPPDNIVREIIKIIEQAFTNIYELKKYQTLSQKYFNEHS